MELDRFAAYLLICEGLCGFGALFSTVAGRWDIAACAWAVACYCAITRANRGKSE